MLQQLHNRYKGATMAVLGSAPSVADYAEKEDIAMALNGAAFLRCRYECFMAGDSLSPKRDWWLASDAHANRANISRIVSSYIAPLDPCLYPDPITRNTMLKDKEAFSREHDYFRFVPSVTPDPPHAFYTFGGAGEPFVDCISEHQTHVYWGGTIAAMALQAALVMGANQIHLYGCEFRNAGSHYFYAANDQRGGISENHLVVMQKTIDKIRSLDRKVIVHGPSLLV